MDISDFNDFYVIELMVKGDLEKDVWLVAIKCIF